MESNEIIISVNNSGVVIVGKDYTIGQILDAIELARKTILNIVLQSSKTV